MLSTCNERFSMKKTYIIICGFADVVAGGPIYYSNKIRYMEALGWNVVVIPTNGGKKVYISGMEKYLGPYIPFILDMPSEYSKKQQKRLLDIFLKFIPKEIGETVVETGTDYTDYWGEALAEKIGAKHIVIFLDEQNPRISKTLDFYKFKYDRNELACISKPVMRHMFKPLMNLPLDKCKALSCNCTNSIQDIDSDLANQIVRGDYTIGYIGRLEKPFLPTIVDGFLEFAKTYPDKKISIVFFGGSFEQETTDILYSQFACLHNVNIMITGYLYPLPLKALQKMDIFVSGAGSSRVGAKAGVLSLNIDMLTYRPDGFRYANGQLNSLPPLGDTVFDNLKAVLVDKMYVPKPSVDIDHDWDLVCDNFAEHVKFMNSSSTIKAYYDVNRLNMSRKRRAKRFFRTILGLRIYNALHNFHAWIAR